MKTTALTSAYPAKTKQETKKISKFGKANGALKGKISETPDCWDLKPFDV
jgi:hypothetical protein